jgi:cytochrome d ubiquinol oxidase subunit I
MGRQPWAVFGMLPTWMSASSHSVGYMVFSLIGFVLLYTVFAVIEMFLMVRSIRKGPDGDHAETKSDLDPLEPAFERQLAAVTSTHMEH